MNMDQAAVFLAGSILIALGFTVVVAAMVFVNNMLHKYWKPVSIFTPESWKAFNPPLPHFIDQETNKDKK